jgi:hypothetical protein
MADSMSLSSPLKSAGAPFVIDEAVTNAASCCRRKSILGDKPTFQPGFLILKGLPSFYRYARLYSGGHMRPKEPTSPSKTFVPKAADPPIKMPNPPDEKQPEIPKVGSRDAPGG